MPRQGGASQKPFRNLTHVFYSVSSCGCGRLAAAQKDPKHRESAIALDKSKTLARNGPTSQMGRANLRPKDEMKNPYIESMTGLTAQPNRLRCVQLVVINSTL
jgi:hypothetical protein